MSRSRKKHPYIKDKGTFMRQYCSRAHRRASHIILSVYCHQLFIRPAEYSIAFIDWCNEPPDEPQFPDRRTLVNSYDVCDWKMCDKTNPKYFRK